MRTRIVLACLTVVLLTHSNLRAGAIVFDNRQNVDILHADNVTITTNPTTNGGNNLIGHIDGAGFWEGGVGGGTGQTITMNFGQVRGVKTLRLWNTYALQTANVTIETSTTGLAGSWTPVTTTLTNPDSGKEANIVLAAAADTQYLRITNNTSTRIVEQDLRVYGDTGTLTDTGNHLSLISSTGYTGVTQTITTVGGSIQGLSPMINGNPSAFVANQDVFGLGTNDTVTINLGETVQFSKFGFYPSAAFRDTSSTFEFKVFGSTTGAAGTFTTQLLDQVGPEAALPTFYNLAAFTGQALQMQIVNTAGGTGADLRIADFFVTGAVPEPASLALLAAGGLLLLRRRSDRRRVAA